MDVHTAYQQSLAKVKQKPVLFLIAMLGQLVVFFFFAQVLLTSTLTILEGTQAIIEPIEQANFNPDAIDQGTPFLSDLAAINQAYTTLMESIRSFFVKSSLILILGQGPLWILMHHFNKPLKKESVLDMLAKYVLSTTALIALFLVASYAIIKTTIARVAISSTQAAPGALYLVLILFLIVAYLYMNTAVTLRIKDKKNFLKTTWKRAKMLKKTLKLTLLSLAPIALIFYLFSLAANAQSFPALFVLTLILAAKLLGLMLFWIVSFEKKQDENSTH